MRKSILLSLLLIGRFVSLFAQNSNFQIKEILSKQKAFYNDFQLAGDNYEIVNTYSQPVLFDVVDDIIYYYSSGYIKGLDAKTKNEVYSSNKLEIDSHYLAFISIDKENNSLYYGLTVGGNTNDRIYKLNLQTKEWTLLTTLACNFDGEVHDGQLYVSGLGYSDWNTPEKINYNSIWLINTSLENNRQQIIQIAGNSTGFCFSPEGDIICGEYSLSGTYRTYRWKAEKVKNAIDNKLLLTAGDAEILSDMDCGMYDCACTKSGDIYWNLNNFMDDKCIVKWNGVIGASKNYEIVASQSSGWLGMIQTDGDLLYMGGTSNNVTCIKKKNNSTAIEKDILHDVQVYPNPFVSHITINNVYNGSYRIIDLQGNIIVSGFVNQNKQNIELNYLTQGTYVLNLVSGHSNRNFKIIKTR